MKKLTKSQLEVMQVLWNSENPLSAADITETNHKLNTSTIRASLQTLLKAEFIKVADVAYSGTVLTRLYAPLVTADDYITATFFKSGKKPFSKHLIAHLIEEENDLSVLDEVEALLHQRRKELEGGD